ncbi:MAG TPA: alkaline phosphatase family protein [Vicinamibacterales bacterium]|jgi:hypothetical protein
MSETKPSVDELRVRLRELGYLDAGMDRFVLGPVRGSRGVLSAAWRSSVRIGLLAGILLGPSAAIALGVRLPGLATGARDTVVLAVYLGVLFGAGVAGIAFVATSLLGAGVHSRLNTRASSLARMAGAGVAAACLVYLVLWWRTVNPAGTVWRSGAWTIPALAAASAISLLLGHAVRMTTLALAAQGAATPLPPHRLEPRSWVVTLVLGVMAFAVASLLLFVATRGEERTPGTAAPAIAVIPTGIHLTVVAIDGLDLRFLERLQSTGRTPRLARLLAGARMQMPASEAPDPARTWTSLATGQPADVHGVSGIETRRVAGIEGTVPAGESGLAASIGMATDLVRLTRPALTTGLQRRSKTFWEVAAENRLRTVVVNWWATWPVPAAPGIVLSDRATLRLDRGGDLDGELGPAGLYRPLREAWPEMRDSVRRSVLHGFPAGGGAEAAVLRRAAEQDAVQVALASRVFTSTADLCALYLPGLDIAQHELLGGGGAGLPASAMASRVDALERYYQFLDQLLAPLVDGLPSSSLVALVADPGRAASRESGVLALSGSGVQTGARVVGTGADVGPTLLYILGLPTSRELSGHPRLDLLDSAFTARIPLRIVDTYGHRTLGPRPSTATPLDQEMLDRLRSLGYVR